MAQIQTNVGGLRAVELNYRPMIDVSSGSRVCYISRTHLNTPGLGVLLPDVFRPVTEHAGVSEELFNLELLQLLEAAKEMNEKGLNFRWISLDMPLSILRSSETPDIVNDMCEKFQTTSNEIAFCVPYSVLATADKEARKGISRMRRHGYHMMLPDFGKNGCPMINLAKLAVDHVMIDESVTAQLRQSDRTDKAVGAIISYIKGLDAEPVAAGVRTSTQAETLYELGCNYCIGSLPGDYMTLEEMIDRWHK